MNPTLIDLCRCRRSRAAVQGNVLQLEFSGAGQVGSLVLDGTGATNVRSQHFLYDMKSRRVIGELVERCSAFRPLDQTKLSCDGYQRLSR